VKALKHPRLKNSQREPLYYRHFSTTRNSQKFFKATSFNINRNLTQKQFQEAWIHFRNKFYRFLFSVLATDKHQRTDQEKMCDP
jgi:hypothetical protein